MIEKLSDLPPIGTPEDDGLDFKRQFNRDVHGFDQVEIAKDVAALANAFGGTLLVGAQEVDHRLESYPGLSAEECAEHDQICVQAVSNRCVPAPVIRPARIERAALWMLAINVWANSSATVGVLRKPVEAAAGERIREPSYMFPIRRGAHTTYLNPGQLFLIQLPEVRRAFVMLALLPRDQQFVLHDGKGRRQSAGSNERTGTRTPCT